MMAQMMVAAASTAPDKKVRNISAIFARPGRTDAPLTIDVEVIHTGRTLASATTSISQDDRILSRALILLDAGDTDVIRHSASLPSNAGRPEDAAPWTTNAQGTEVRIAQGVDMTVVAPNGPPELLVWFRVPDATADPVMSQALAASRSHLFLIGAAMRPHEGIGASMAHESLSTGVLTHALSFHDSVDVSSWLLFVNESTYAGAGRAYGHGAVYSEDGRHVASFSQNSLIRHFSDDFATRGKQYLVL
jgi:acyl-CoA thioesterase II